MYTTPPFIQNIFERKKLILILFIIVALFVAIKYTFFADVNNYTIFFYSLRHLIDGKSLYAAYPEEYLDYFLYSPTFGAIFSPILILPYKIGLFIWPFLFTGFWVLAVNKMPWTEKQKMFAWWFGIQELLTAVDNVQTNPLIAAIPLFAFVCIDKGKFFWAAFFIALGFYVKVYSLVTAALFIVYPNKLKFLLSLVFWFVVFALLPLLVTSPAKLVWQYQLWFDRLFQKSDHDHMTNVSIHRIINQTISSNIPPSAIIAVGILLFCSVFVHIKEYKETYFKMLLLASILIFHVIFNPVSESATYITAVTGVIVWWLYCPKNYFDWFLVVFCYIFTVMGPTDLMPRYIRKQFIEPYVLKALPAVLIWFRVLYLMHFPSHKITSNLKDPGSYEA
ncbi:glycosyltransferase family 87 protein [Segetibacter sp.]|jgi:hypothetical protein|uniref:glycosyltransferase family 87 protein n=1 Tax=Segetibacter sp. TaxID=2231182 RepID=UPI00261D21B5|nr:glycosyltransferase family 87 protein [Segetibacter sp.]MCW3079008.1 hypothetical protein [Segetibacter sp.]